MQPGLLFVIIGFQPSDACHALNDPIVREKPEFGPSEGDAYSFCKCICMALFKAGSFQREDIRAGIITNSAKLSFARIILPWDIHLLAMILSWKA